MALFASCMFPNVCVCFILGRPFLNTVGAIIYASNAKITFNIKGNREAFCHPSCLALLELLFTISAGWAREHRTISLRALMESQATKPSRRWQPPRVTSTTCLQYEHLVPLDTIALESLTHTIRWLLSSICELEGSQAPPHKPPSP